MPVERPILTWDHLKIKLLIKAALPRLSPSQLRSDMATHSPSQIGYKIKKRMLLLQRLPLHARLVTLAKSWPVCLTMREATLHETLTSSGPGRWTTLDLWPPLRPISGASLLLTLFQVTVLLFQSDQLSPNKSVWPLKLICVMWSASQTICRQDNNVPFVEKATHNGLIVKVFSHPPMLLPSTGIWCCGFWPASSKINLKRFLTLFSSPLSGLYTLVRQFGHWMKFSPKRNHPFSATS